MSQAEEPGPIEPLIDLLEEGRFFGQDPNGNWVALSVDANGELEVSLAGETIELEGDDDDGNTLQVAVETLSQAITDPDGLVTYQSRALNSQGDDELVSRVAGADGVQVAEETLDTTALAGTTDALVTHLSAALNDVGTDELVSRLTDSTGAQIDPATTALENALKTNDTDELVARITGANGVEVEETALDTPPAVTDTGLVTFLAGALNDVGQDELVSRITDSTGGQIDPSRATDFPNQQVVGEDLTVDDTVIGPVTVARSEALVVAVNETTGGTLDVTVDWEDQNGNVFQSEGPSTINLNDVTEDWARLVRKGPQARITLSNNAGATSTNAHADTQR